MNTIDSMISGRNVTRVELAKALGIDRGTLSRRLARIDKDTLRAVADYLGVAYPEVLMAALVEAGYLDDPTELLAGHPVYLVSAVDGLYDNERTPERVFFDKESADRYVSVYRELGWREGRREVDEVAVLPAGSLPATVTVYTARWTSRLDRIEITTTRHTKTPASWTDGHAGVAVFVQATREGVGVITVETSAVTEGAARRAVAATVAALNENGLLAPSSMTANPNGDADNGIFFAEPSESLSELVAKTAALGDSLTSEVATKTVHLAAEAALKDQIDRALDKIDAASDVNKSRVLRVLTAINGGVVPEVTDAELDKAITEMSRPADHTKSSGLAQSIPETLHESTDRVFKVDGTGVGTLLGSAPWPDPGDIKFPVATRYLRLSQAAAAKLAQD